MAGGGDKREGPPAAPDRLRATEQGPAGHSGGHEDAVVVGHQVGEHEDFADGNSGILWTSHNMGEVHDMCDRVLFMSKGKILLEGNPKTLPAEYGKQNLEELFIAVAREPLTLESAHAV